MGDAVIWYYPSASVIEAPDVVVMTATPREERRPCPSKQSRRARRRSGVSNG